MIACEILRKLILNHSRMELLIKIHPDSEIVNRLFKNTKRKLDNHLNTKDCSHCNEVHSKLGSDMIGFDV